MSRLRKRLEVLLAERLNHQRDWDALLLLKSCEELVESLHTQSCPEEWGLTREGFLAGLARSVQKRLGTHETAKGNPLPLRA